MDILKSLNITNVLKLIEVVLLLKPYQSGTERTMLCIKKIASRYPNVYRHGCRNKDKIDMVNVLAFLKLKKDFR